jgi:Lrp/AsnC family transcriptional regulator, regulator for asnA, asnC and gidA
VNDPIVNLDELDYQILSLLLEDGRKSFSDIAKEIKVAVNTVRNRVGRMVEDKTLTFLARVDPYRAGFKAHGTISISVEPSNMVDEVAQQLCEVPETSFLVMISGEYDLLMDVMCYDIQQFSNLVKRIQDIPGVRKTHTTFFMKVYRYASPRLFSMYRKKLNAAEKDN